jgi:membrane-associated phospholipid phosphatase
MASVRLEELGYTLAGTPGKLMRTRRILRAHPGRLVLVALLAAAVRAEGQENPPAEPPAVYPAPQPGLGLQKARLLGAAAGLALGAALARRLETSVPALRSLRGIDAILTGSAGALYLGGELVARKGSAPDRAAVAAPAGEINGFDRKIRKLAVGRRSLEKRLLLDHLSSTTLMVSLFQPIGMTIASDAPHKWSRDVPVIVEATALTLSVNAFVKHLTHRSRPAAHFCESEHAVYPCPPDERVSFYSGHTSSAFAAAVAAGTIADFHRFENRKWIWASGLTFATATGVLRVMSDQHYATDVLTGTAAGGLAGWLIPKLHKPDRTATPPATARMAAPAVLAAVPIVVGARSATLVTVGSVGGGPYVGIHCGW